MHTEGCSPAQTLLQVASAIAQLCGKPRTRSMCSRHPTRSDGDQQICASREPRTLEDQPSWRDEPRYRSGNQRRITMLKFSQVFVAVGIAAASGLTFGFVSSKADPQSRYHATL